MGIRCKFFMDLLSRFYLKEGGESVNSLNDVWIGFWGIWIISVDWL